MSHPHVIIDGIAVPIVSGGADEGDAPTGDLAGAATSAMDRIDAAFADNPDYVDPELSEGAPETPSATAAPEGEGGDDDEGMTYAKAKELRAEQKAYRERWGAFEQAFQGLPDESVGFARQVMPLIARGNADAALVLGEYAGLHPDDRAIVDQIADAAATNPQAAAAAFAEVAEQLRGAGAEDLEPEVDDDDFDEPDEPQYVTVEDLDERISTAAQRFAFEQREQAEVQSILAEVKDLGYDLESDDLHEQARVESLFALARRLGGDIGQAHEALSGMRQATVDEYVSGKAADAGRPQPPMAGAPASGERRLDTLEDAEAAMRARMAAHL